MNEMKQKASLWIEPGKPRDGDFRVTSSNAAKENLYSYRFLGGRKGRGHLSSKVDSPEEYELEIRSEGYVIHEIEFIGDGGQLKHANKNACTTLATISNAATKVMQGYYHVIVQNTKTKELIDCDPMISNDPKG